MQPNILRFLFERDNKKGKTGRNEILCMIVRMYMYPSVESLSSNFDWILRKNGKSERKDVFVERE